MGNPVISDTITLADIRYARVVYAYLDRDYAGGGPPLRVRITKAQAEELLKTGRGNCVYRWDGYDDLTFVPGEMAR